MAFNQDSNASPATYQLTLEATNGSGTPVRQTFAMIVDSKVNITSPSSISVKAGIPVNFLVTTTGYPVPALSASSGLLPLGMTFTDNRNGTATISGTASNLNLTICSLGSGPYGITATNAAGSVFQAFNVSVTPAPAANLVSAASATFIAGAPNSDLLVSSGATTPVSYIFTPPANASWLAFKDNGNGTAVLSGTPPSGTTGTYSFSVCPIAAGAGQVCASGGSFNNFTLNVVDTPVFLSGNAAGFAVGKAGSFEVKTNGGQVSSSSIFPAGLTFNAGSSASITGTPQPGTGGVYNLTLTDNGGSLGSSTQQFTLSIIEGPTITSASSATFFTGMPGYFAVTTLGYPSRSIAPLASLSLLPQNGFLDGMSFGVLGLPSDLQFSNLNPQGFATGTLVIQGTPSAADVGLHKVQIAAFNSVGVAAEQTLMLNIVKITGPAPASGTACNGNYNGTFKGSITVSNGQNCSFVDGGGVTGNIAMRGGNFTMANDTIGGNVQIAGDSAFSFGPGSKVGGNLSVDLVSSGATVNQICGTTVQGNLAVIGNATRLNVGSASANDCGGNAIGGNLTIDLNTAPISVYDNSVGKNLSCLLNTSINGAGNAAERKQGQCTAF